MPILSFSTKVLDKKTLAQDVILLSFSRPEEFDFKAGQFITLAIEKDGEKKNRSYSILSPPSQKDSLDLAIKIVEDGFASEVFDSTQIGDSFEGKGPFGHFVFDNVDENKEMWFIGGGTGLAPLYSMVKEYLLNSTDRRFVLLFSVKTQNDLFLHQELLRLEQNTANFTYKPTLTREEWDGLMGRVTKHLPESTKNKTFYICGLKELVLDSKAALENLGVAKENLKFERYT